MPPFRSIIPPKASLAFLVSQVGAHIADRFAQRLKPHKLTPAHSGVLRIINHEGGISQQKLAKILGMFPSRLVLVLDELQHMGLIQRSASSSDRRISALHLTKKGLEKLEIIGRVGQELQDDLCAKLNTEDRKILSQLLSTIAHEQGLVPGIHPGFKYLKS